MATPPPVTFVDVSGEKVTLMVDGKPFFYLGTQISPHRLEPKGWSWAAGDMAVFFQTVARDGFTVMACPFDWNKLEVARDVFDWSRLEKAIDHAAAAGIKMEFLWFGGNVCGTYNQVPKFYSEFQKVAKRDGTPLLYKNHAKFDLCDPALLAREQRVLGQVMAHVARYTAERKYPTTVIGVQVSNEPTVVACEGGVTGAYATDRSYSAAANAKWAAGGYTDATAFNTDVLWEYLHGLAKAVKESEYPVWTRINFCDRWETDVALGVVAKNEAMRAAGGTHLDFVGNDPYSNRIEEIYSYCTDPSRYHRGKNFVMVMENGGAYSRTDKLVFNALAGNAAYNIWELSDSFLVTGPCKDQGLYSLNADKTLTPKRHVPAVRNLLAMLNKDARDLATLKAGGERLRFFNRTFSKNSSGTQDLHGTSVSYASEDGGAGIVAARPGQLVFMSMAPATFTLPSRAGITSLQKGHFDADDAWVNEGSIPFSTAGGNISFAIGAYECVRLEHERTPGFPIGHGGAASPGERPRSP